MPRKNTPRRKLVVQFIEYMVSGGVYFWVGYGLLLYFNNYFHNDLHWSVQKSLWWATIISNVAGWTANYILQRFWVFNNKNLKDHKTEVTGRYIFITLVDFVLNYFILLGLNNVGIPPKYGQFISSGFFTVWNYLWYRFWVFPEKIKRKKTLVTPARVIAHRAHGHLAYHKVKS
ncbi:GtrA family protein [Candidatus Saccharibacteria bacterium]|nr:GtrA family protein [Candidatus Saccharibacteria bacterium]